MTNRRKTIQYLCQRFHQEKIILMGHSYGTLLGTTYVSRYPDKVACYIGIGQTISIKDSLTENYLEVKEILKGDERKRNQLEVAYRDLMEDEQMNMDHYMKFQRLTIPVLISQMKDLKKVNQIGLIFASPDRSFKDIRWLLSTLRLNKHYTRNKKLLDYTMAADVRNLGKQFSVPMHFISGEYDRTCCVSVLQPFFEEITAPDKSLTIMEKSAHSPQVDDQVAFVSVVKKILHL